MASNPVRWFEIYVQDMERAKEFYESVFQVNLEKLNSESPELWAFPMSMDGPGASGALVKMKGFSSGGNNTVVYFGSEDCAVELKRVVPAGGRIQCEKRSLGEYGFAAWAFDPDGNMFGIHSMR
jgi:predicted enzyme related to lactoylglutathione lyase